MAKKTMKFDMNTLVVLGAFTVAVILAVVGTFVAWTSTSITILGNTSTSTSTLIDWLNGNSDLGEIGLQVKYLGADAAFTYVALALTVLTTLAFVAFKFVDFKYSKLAVVALAALTFIFAVLSFVFAIMLVSNLPGEATSIAVGPILLLVSGVLSAAGGVWAYLKA